MRSIDLVMESASGTSQLKFNARHLVCAGFTGRDQASVRKHLLELESMGVSAPKKIPVAYHVPEDLLTTGGEIRVDGNMTSGEVECVALFDGGGIYITVGSDHTDRDIERSDIQKSKEACPKVIAGRVWPFAEVAPHWDRLEIASYDCTGGQDVLYQVGALAQLLTPEAVIEKGGLVTDGLVLFCGTLPLVSGQMRYAERFRMELRDPVLKRSIVHDYFVRAAGVRGFS